MCTLPNFCRVCLKYDKNLIDLAHIEKEPNETLLSKLQLCVSEVDWNEYKPLLCHPCIKRLNIAHGFIKQSIQSASALKNYVDLIKEQQNESNVKMEPANTIMLLPNQKLVKIVVGSQSETNTFQSVFLNLIPAISANDRNQNVTASKFVPIAPRKRNVDSVYSQLTESKTEELSVELDPTDFAGMQFDDCASSNDEEINDYEDVLSSTKIDSTHSNDDNTAKSIYETFVPILPKEDFSESGEHFLSSAAAPSFACGVCQKLFSSRKQLRNHNFAYHVEDDEKSRSESNEITLEDFAQNDGLQTEESENGDYKCSVCENATFNNASSLLRHKVRKHNKPEKPKKKYFIKGMKNAKCDICNRAFSTQSYMQMHRKLHLREDFGYKYKVFAKSKYDNGMIKKDLQDDYVKKNKNADSEYEIDESDDDD